MQSAARLSPTRRDTLDLEHRIRRFKGYEQWKPPHPVDFGAIIGDQEWTQYWAAYDQLADALRTSQGLADHLKSKIAAAHAQQPSQRPSKGRGNAPPSSA